MSASDVAFSGSVPANYHRYLVPLLFTPYADDLASRAAAVQPASILETAAGTGVVTAALLERLPEARIVATDLNQAMLDVAGAEIGSDGVEFQQADAQALPFQANRFDMVVTQFGLMFYPDRGLGYREALRVLKPGGTFLFNVWDSLSRNPVSEIIAEEVRKCFPDDPPSFLERVPFGYHDVDAIIAELKAAGFTGIEAEKVRKVSQVDPVTAAGGLCKGSPLLSEIEARDPGRVDEVCDKVTAALIEWGGDDVFEAPMSAIVVTARKPG